MEPRTVNPLTQSLLKAFANPQIAEESRGGMKVNPLISEVAFWFEKVRNAMDYREDEVVLRAAIERVLRRRFIFGGSGKTVASPLLRELIWARYFPNESIPDAVIEQVSQTIDLYIALRSQVAQKKLLKEAELDTYFYQLLSCAIAQILAPNKRKDIMTNFVFYILKGNITIPNEKEATRDAQVFIAVRKAFAKDDVAYLRYRLFEQFFGKLTPESLSIITNRFEQGYKEIEQELVYPLRFKILAYVKRQIPSFLILEDILLQQDNLEEIFTNQEKLKEVVNEKCLQHYKSIGGKVRRAIVRSFIFLLLTKTFIALGVEGTYDNIMVGHIIWPSILLNISIPPTLMVIASMLITMPGKDNTQKIIETIETICYSPNPVVGKFVTIRKEGSKKATINDIIFSILWIVAFGLSFGSVIFLLSLARFNIISQGVFVFFLAVVAFLIFRIRQTAHTYTVVETQNFYTPIIDFLFMPIAQVGRYITEGVAQVNILLFIFDFIIETPFKSLFGFFEQWFFFLHAKRDYLET